MYEAKQYKEKVSRRIDEGCVARQRRTVRNNRDRIQYFQTTGMKENVLQCATEINYQEETIAYWKGGSHIGYQTVGINMEAFLDPQDPKTGSRTRNGSGIYANKRYKNLVQGHLLNANLGGQAIPQNLFPITSEMNRLHSTSIEDFVKLSFITLGNDKQNNPLLNSNRRLYYRVQVYNPHLNAITPTTIRNTSFHVESFITDNNNPNGQGGITRDANMNHNVAIINTPNNMSLNDELANMGFGPDPTPTYTLDQTQIWDPNNNRFYHYLKDSIGNIDPSLKVYV